MTPDLRVVTAGRAGAESKNIKVTKKDGTCVSFTKYLYVVKIYEPRPRQKDGLFTYRLAAHVGDQVWSEKKAERLAREYAEEQGLTYEWGVAHGHEMDSQPAFEDLPPDLQAEAKKRRWPVWTEATVECSECGSTIPLMEATTGDGKLPLCLNCSWEM